MEHWLLLINDKVCWHMTEPGAPARPVVLGSPDEVMAYAKATFNVEGKSLRARKVTPVPAPLLPVAPGFLEYDGSAFTELDDPALDRKLAWAAIATHVAESLRREPPLKDHHL